MRPKNSSLADTTISAAADGVGARRSATKSAIVVSVSWPTAEITGTGDIRDRAGDDFLVERPQVFDRTAPAADDDDVDAGHSCNGPQTSRDVEGRPFALNPGGTNHDLRIRIPSPEHLDDVPNRRAVERGHDPDLPGQRRERSFPRRLEQPFGLEPLLQLVERQLQRSKPLRLQVFADDLIFALGLVDRNLAACDDAQTVSGLEFQYRSDERNMNPRIWVAESLSVKNR